MKQHVCPVFQQGRQQFARLTPPSSGHAPGKPGHAAHVERYI
jgi:hypothetical protein